MQGELDAEGLVLDVRILGVNQEGYESGNAGMVAGRTLPWLQDVADVDAYGLWRIRFRDVVVLDEQNVLVTVYNVDDHDLRTAENYETLKGILRAAATP